MTPEEKQIIQGIGQIVNNTRETESRSTCIAWFAGFILVVGISILGMLSSILKAIQSIGI